MTAKTMKAAFSSTLRVLHIPGLENTDEHLDIISKNCHQLVDLNISQIEYTLESHISLSWSSSVTATSLCNLCRCCTALTSIDMSGLMNVTPECIAALPKHNMRSLSLAHCGFSSQYSGYNNQKQPWAVAEAITNMKNLGTSLNLAGMSLSPDAIMELGKYCKSLTAVNLSGSIFNSGSQTENIGSYFSKLQELVVSRVHSNGVESLLKHLRELRSFADSDMWGDLPSSTLEVIVCNTHVTRLILGLERPMTSRHTFNDEGMLQVFVHMSL